LISTLIIIVILFNNIFINFYLKIFLLIFFFKKKYKKKSNIQILLKYVWTTYLIFILVIKTSDIILDKYNKE